LRSVAEHGQVSRWARGKMLPMSSLQRDTE